MILSYGTGSIGRKGRVASSISHSVITLLRDQYPNIFEYYDPHDKCCNLNSRPVLCTEVELGDNLQQMHRQGVMEFGKRPETLHMNVMTHQ